MVSFSSEPLLSDSLIVSDSVELFETNTLAKLNESATFCEASEIIRLSVPLELAKSSAFYELDELYESSMVALALCCVWSVFCTSVPQDITQTHKRESPEHPLMAGRF